MQTSHQSSDDAKHLFKLSDEQAKIVYSPMQLNVVRCCPGAGKTHVICARAKRLREDFGEQVLIVTFSKQAAADITRRLGAHDPGIKASTIHSFCLGIVREHWVTLGRMLGKGSWPEDPIIVGRKEEIRLTEEILPGGNPKRSFEIIEELRRFSEDPESIKRMVARGAYVGRATLPDIVAWAKYETERRSRGLLTYDDMAHLAEMLIPLPAVSGSLVNRYPHILIDEGQDTSYAQWKVLRPLIASSKSTLIAGDLNQSVYTFRDADGSLLRRVEELGEALSFTLRTSYRLTGWIAKLANMIVPDGLSHFQENGGGNGTVCVKGFTAADAEVDYILSNLTQSTAILARTNAYLEPFERALIDRQIPYTGSAFYRSEHIASMAAMLRKVTGDPGPIVRKAFLENGLYDRVQREDIKLALGTIRRDGLPTFLGLVDQSLPADAGVTLSTGHAAKGLEWDRVFVVGVHNGHVPHRLSLDPAEEERLFYVMTTRPRKELVLTYIGQPSRFIPKEVLEWDT